MNFNQFIGADIFQLLIARYYERSHGAGVVSIGNMPEWDIKFADETTVEIKYDAKAAQTQNACIEFWNVVKDKPTGILTTQSQLWVHCLPELDKIRCYEVSTKRLLRLCLETGIIRSGGDNNANLLKIIPLCKIKEISQHTFSLSNEIVSFASGLMEGSA